MTNATTNETRNAYCESCGRPAWMAHRRFCKANRVASAAKAAATRARNDADAGTKANPFEVGDILTGSWGYDQTNVEFYQVVAATPATVTIRSIDRLANVQAAYMTAKSWPAKDQFVGKPIRKMVNRYGSVKLYDFGCYLKKWDGAGKWSSSYA